MSSDGGLNWDVCDGRGEVWIDRRELQVRGWMPFRHGLDMVVGEGDVT